jgi:hypothetical protein
MKWSARLGHTDKSGGYVPTYYSHGQSNNVPDSLREVEQQKYVSNKPENKRCHINPVAPVKILSVVMPRAAERAFAGCKNVIAAELWENHHLGSSKGVPCRSPTILPSPSRKSILQKVTRAPIERTLAIGPIVAARRLQTIGISFTEVIVYSGELTEQPWRQTTNRYNPISTVLPGRFSPHKR